MLLRVVCATVALWAVPLLVVPSLRADKPSTLSSAQYDQSAENGPHHAWRTHTVTATNELGQVVPVAQRYVEVQVGMHYMEDGQWKPTEERIEIFERGAVARQGPHKAIFSPNLNTRGSVDLEMPDGQRLRSKVIGLSYYDAACGKSVLVAELKDCQGELLPPNRILYPDAFTTLRANVVYTYTKAGLEQDVVILEPPPSPESFGLDPESARLEVLTEMYVNTETFVIESAWPKLP
jgi:hypothetical protein